MTKDWSALHRQTRNSAAPAKQRPYCRLAPVRWSHWAIDASPLQQKKIHTWHVNVSHWPLPPSLWGVAAPSHTGTSLLSFTSNKTYVNLKCGLPAKPIQPDFWYLSALKQLKQSCNWCFLQLEAFHTCKRSRLHSSASSSRKINT